MTQSTRYLQGPAPQTIECGPDILQTVGRTPLLELPRLAQWAGLPETTRLLAKAEHLNPGGSAKDRLAVALLEAAEHDGLRRGGIVVEATSGNTGIALAQAAAVRGYRLHVVASEKVSEEKVRILQAFGTTVHRVPNRPHGDPLHYIERAKSLANELGGFYPDQFRNPANVRVHETETGPEILDQLAALGITADALVAGVGTGGTLTGLARAFARGSPTTRIILADPVGSILASGGDFAPYKVEGIGDDVKPVLYDGRLIHGWARVPDDVAFTYARAAARLEGILVGGSAGAHLAASVAVAKRLGEHATVCTLLPDTGRNYLSKFLDPEWCKANGSTTEWNPNAQAPQLTEVQI